MARRWIPAWGCQQASRGPRPLLCNAAARRAGLQNVILVPHAQAAQRPSRLDALPKFCLTISQLMANALPRWGR